MGTINFKLLISNNTYTQKFQLVDNKFPIKTDGMIGKNSLKRFLFKIYYETFNLSLNDDETITHAFKAI